MRNSRVLIAVWAFWGGLGLSLSAEEYNSIPYAWKWLDSKTVAFSYDGTYEDSQAFTLTMPTLSRGSVPADAASLSFMEVPVQDAVNPTWSPDSSRVAFTRDNDIYVLDVESGQESRLTYDGSEVILNGYASWVYYEEIFGRASQYKAFWWSPDSRKLAYYRFDNSSVPMFPIYSPFGQDGYLKQTRYPKAGEPNPQVRIGIVDVQSAQTIWADFDETQDQYFGTPFWSDDSGALYVPREPRVQNTLDLYAVAALDGSKEHIYHEEYPTWLDWIEDIWFGRDGLYMARAFETGWQQIYYLSYDGQELRRLTDGPNWAIHIERVDEARGDVFFTAQRDSRVHSTLYKVDRKGVVTALTDPMLGVSGVAFSPDGRYFAASLSGYTTPNQVWVYETRKAGAKGVLKGASKGTFKGAFKVADRRGEGFAPAHYALPELISIKAEDGQDLYGQIVYPVDFDSSHKYPVHVEIYGGPGTAYVRDRWVRPNADNQWWSEHGIIHIVIDSRVSGHNGRRGTDLDHLDVLTTPVCDFVTWGRWLQSLPYVQADKIGIEGFSFGGAMTALMLFTHSDVYHYGIAGGGVYDWMLYDTHYTERFMDTPANNPDGYARCRVLDYVDQYPVGPQHDGSVMLKITHGTGDDNVHLQNSLQLIDALQRADKLFELMLYPDGMHGYRGEQWRHSQSSDHLFWQRYLLGE